MTDITMDDLSELFSHFAKNPAYKAKDPDSKLQAFMQRCILLADVDYTHTVISNNAGELSAHYPSHLIILENEKSHNQNEVTPPRMNETIYESVNDSKKLLELMKKARFARCRSRFPLPVILYKSKNICRSATLSSGPEIYGRHGLAYFFDAAEQTEILADGTPNVDEEEKTSEISLSEWQLYDKVRQCDIKLLKNLNVGTIIDFMVEKKKVKFGMNVTSSEKVDKEKRYSEFKIIPLPYPGCEFFREFRENDYLASGLFFNWTQNYVDAEVVIPTDSVTKSLNISWENYRKWDLISLTENYMKLILAYLRDSTSGLLLHCISGWDRTPLFISLLRVSLWADGVIHTSLNALQMLYYTVAYDWMLFGHDLQDRVAKGEDIFHFCFHFLKYIISEDYSVHNRIRHIERNESNLHLENDIFENDSQQPLSSVSSNLSLNSCCSNNSYNSRDSQDNNPPSVFHCSISLEDKEDAQNNGNVPSHCITTHWSSSPNKDTAAAAAAAAATATANQGGTRSPLPTNRTSPVAVPVPGRVRQRNESSSSGGSWQMISTTGSLHGTTTANAAVSSDGIPTGITTSQESNATLISSDIVIHDTPRAEKLTKLRHAFYKVYPTTVGLKLKENECGFSQMLGNFADKILPGQRASSST